MKKVFLFLSLIGVVLILSFKDVFAGAPWGEVLPKGRSWLKVYYVSTWASEKYNEDRKIVPLVTGFKSDARENVPAMEYGYGLTDDLSVGTIIPYTYRSYKLEPQTIPEQKASGIGDVKLGGQYRYYKTDILTLTFRSTVKLPTGKVDDPNDREDIDIGTGQTYIEFTNYVDYYLLEKTWVASGMLRYNLQLEGEYDASNAQIARLGNTYKKKIGDELWLAAGLERRDIVAQGLSASMRIEERIDMKDDYTSNSQTYDESKEKNTSGDYLFLQPEIKYSAYKIYKIPVRVYSNYRIPVSGKNNYVTNRLEIGIDIFF
ncbi:MAG: hypothetical protein PHE88_08515 [Elusimicrobia bacterium]|nr:hypothetical protein [Elusimicrobiota bacterium]